VPTIIGDFFETVTNALVRSKNVSWGIRKIRPDLICRKGLIEVKAGYDTGKVLFKSSQVKYYKEYFDFHFKEYGRNVFYFFYWYKKNKKPFYYLESEEEVYKFLANNLSECYLFDQYAFGKLYGAIRIPNYCWRGLQLECFYKKDIDEFLKRKDVVIGRSIKISEFLLNGLWISNFEIKVCLENEGLFSEFRNVPERVNDEIDIGSFEPVPF
jgi:hypothetical protein